MTTSSDTPESFDLPSPTRGPLALILGALSAPASLAVTHMSQLASAGHLNAEQTAHFNDAMRAIQHIVRTVEPFAPPPARAAVRAASGERWSAGEQSDALDDNAQDSFSPLDDRPGRDEQP